MDIDVTRPATAGLPRGYNCRNNIPKKKMPGALPGIFSNCFIR
jgi:hypothetical protein